MKRKLVEESISKRSMVEVVLMQKKKGGKFCEQSSDIIFAWSEKVGLFNENFYLGD